ncbi:oxygenase MpaB family protein [Iamia sp.]|uniref:oxygenase MpaB family protein n=1 Tax=Iamia sp. TaxID=2722710 RepID=UPI002C7E7AE4|nr:oxygenase MpaB family protein [Iamia sp.]HXH59151.1 oxygenase MpaB family protein [Iamia sp.]
MAAPTTSSSTLPPSAPTPRGIPTSDVELWRPALPSPMELALGLAAGASGRVSAPLIAQPLAMAFGRMMGAERPPPHPVEEAVAGAGDPGWFGPDSATWRVHSDHSLLVSGFASFALQALHPRALAGVVEHSAFDGDFMGRTQRTGEYVLTVSFGTSDQAERATALLPRIHDRVVGVAPDGRPYSANEPELLDFVHVAQFVATAAAHRRFGAHPLSDADLDRYIAENARVGAAVGVLDPPRTWAEAMAALDRHRPDLAIGEQAREGLRYLAEPPFLPSAARPLWRALHAGAMASLPPFARRLMGIERTNPVDLALCRAIIRNLGALLPPPMIAIEARRRVAA